MGCVVSIRKVFLKVLEVQGQKHLQIQHTCAWGSFFRSTVFSQARRGEETLVHNAPSSFNHEHLSFIPHDKHTGISFGIKLLPLICLSSSSLYTGSSGLQAENVRYLLITQSSSSNFFPKLVLFIHPQTL